MRGDIYVCYFFSNVIVYIIILVGLHLQWDCVAWTWRIDYVSYFTVHSRYIYYRTGARPIKTLSLYGMQADRLDLLGYTDDALSVTVFLAYKLMLLSDQPDRWKYYAHARSACFNVSFKKCIESDRIKSSWANNQRNNFI